ncbi:MAG: hypothetical protein IKN64_05265 [Desulfovibrio sp.]|nr:hypothetical protein [Desulfovibrio sp.]
MSDEAPEKRSAFSGLRLRKTELAKVRMDAFTDLPSSQKGSNLKVLACNLCIKTAKNCNQKHRKKTCFLQTTGQKACPGFLSSTRAPNASWGMAFKHQGRHLGSTFSRSFLPNTLPKALAISLAFSPKMALKRFWAWPQGACTKYAFLQIYL